MFWTKKHDNFCLTHKITANSAVLLFKSIIRKTKSDTTEEIEIELKNFNRWIKRQRGKGYDPKTLKEALNTICDRSEGMVTIHKKYSWHCYKLIVKPVTFFSGEKSPENGKDAEARSSNPLWHRSSKDERYLQQQQNINKVKQLTERIGLKYCQDALIRIWRLSGKSIERIAKAIELMLYNNSSTPIAKPHGFLMECLKRNWQEGFDPYYEPELPRFENTKELRRFTEALII